MAVCLVQLKELDKTAKTLNFEKNFFEDKFRSIENLHTKVTLEFDTLKFKYAQICRDLMDTIVKMNLSSKARHGTENMNQKLQERLKDQDKQLEDADLSKKKDDRDLKRLRDLNTSFQNELNNSMQTKLNLDKLMKDSTKEYEIKLKTLNFLYSQEKNTCDIYKKCLEEEKNNNRSLNTKCHLSDDNRRKSEVELSKVKIEAESSKKSEAWISLK